MSDTFANLYFQMLSKEFSLKYVERVYYLQVYYFLKIVLLKWERHLTRAPKAVVKFMEMKENKESCCAMKERKISCDFHLPRCLLVYYKLFTNDCFPMQWKWKVE